MARRRTPSDIDPRFVLAGLVVVSFLLALIDGRSASALGGVRGAASTILSPMQNLAFNISSPVVSFLGDWSEVGSKDERIALLQAENETLRRQILGTGDASRRVKELDELLRVAGLGQYRIVTARVMSIGSASGFGATALIDAGSADGIKVNQTVLAGPGMIGRVLSVSEHAATVVLILLCRMLPVLRWCDSGLVALGGVAFAFWYAWADLRGLPGSPWSVATPEPGSMELFGGLLVFEIGRAHV